MTVKFMTNKIQAKTFDLITNVLHQLTAYHIGL